MILLVRQSNDEYFLQYDVYSIKSQYLYSVGLGRISSTEATLREGRFAQFAAGPHPDHITLAKKHMTGGELQDYFRQILNWLGEHATTGWSLEITMVDVAQPIFKFGFADATLAVTFALVWV